jgi:predicted GIY-YIG superfamily endonuclease
MYKINPEEYLQTKERITLVLRLCIQWKTQAGQLEQQIKALKEKHRDRILQEAQKQAYNGDQRAI